MVEQVMMWHSYGQLFDNEEEAKEYEAEVAFEKAVEQIVETFYYRDLDEDDIVKGIIQNKEKLIEILTK
jgi:hypothetical protein